jgi:hypothetical protein
VSLHLLKYPKIGVAGLLSSFGELTHMRTGNPWLKAFDPFSAQPKMSYKEGFQKGSFDPLSLAFI